MMDYNTNYQASAPYEDFQNYNPPPIYQPNKLDEFCRKHEIDVVVKGDLKTLKKFDIVLICDDSGSMDIEVDGGEKTRWDELKDTTKLTIDLATALDDNGIDIIFLNRENVDNIIDYSQVKAYFDVLPGGRTNLSKAIQTAYNKKVYNKPLLIVIATDGEPNDLDKFTRLLANRANDIYVSILACSDNEEEIGYLNELEIKLPRLDVIDDYKSEKKEVIKAQGEKFKYTRGVHIARLLLGPVLKKYDDLDEINLRKADVKQRVRRQPTVQQYTHDNVPEKCCNIL